MWFFTYQIINKSCGKHNLGLHINLAFSLPCLFSAGPIHLAESIGVICFICALHAPLNIKSTYFLTKWIAAWGPSWKPGPWQEHCKWWEVVSQGKQLLHDTSHTVSRSVLKRNTVETPSALSSSTDTLWTLCDVTYWQESTVTQEPDWIRTQLCLAQCPLSDNGQKWMKEPGTRKSCVKNAFPKCSPSF